MHFHHKVLILRTTHPTTFSLLIKNILFATLYTFKYPVVIQYVVM